MFDRLRQVVTKQRPLPYQHLRYNEHLFPRIVHGLAKTHHNGQVDAKHRPGLEAERLDGNTIVPFDLARPWRDRQG